jgi:two-component system phosphate regulon sensor histidine kinase PhoR
MFGAPIERRTVWVVDDSPLDAERAGRALEPNYAVEIFADGSAALERLGSHPSPDVLVLDWVMPGISGIEVCQFLRSDQGGHPQIAILLLTSHQATEQIVTGLSAGANDFLSKPYAGPELEARVASLIRTRRLVERAEAAEASVRAFLASSPDPLIAVDDEGRITYLSDAASSVFGEPPQALQRRLLTDLLPDLPLRQLTARSPERASSIADLRVRDRLYAPSFRVVGDGATGRRIIALRDVTEHRRAEARRLDFYSVIAHDLRSPLNTVLLRTALIGKGKFGELPPALLADIHKIESSLRSQIDLINDFLELASVDSAAYAGERKTIDLVRIVAETLDQLHPLAEDGRIALETNLPPESTLVVGDGRRLMQVLNNLVGNAIKFTPAGGRVIVAVTVTDLEVETSVSDTGAGIAADALPTLFQRFTRAPHAGLVAGNGLGLMIVREIIEAHGGSVGVTSTPGRGSRFWFRLPRPLSVDSRAA